ncbi:STARD3 N-terminal-like protein [Spea bombifrons]|uniref:STARD3 N-terminal-like protein n=1 Tax=Spea bombifrons TaxID=233779 RepID=UPI00234B53F0|nr:STARD3 N-terminal-like protein [Spea bombifrons]XP_053322980.1 STARD3 N-terminal-like protein [Spea bombifrons]
MNHLSDDVPYARSSLLGSHSSVHEVQSVNSSELVARLESYESSGKKGISDVRRTFCLFATFDFLFVTLLWIIELNSNGGIMDALQKEVVQYDYYSSFFDIFLLSFFRFNVLIFAYAMCRIRHWWAVAVTTAATCAFLLVKVILSRLFSQGAFGYVLPIMSFILAWIEAWFLDFKVLPQEAEAENRLLMIRSVSERASLLPPAPVSEGLFYSPPESPAESDEETEEKQDSEKPLV